VERRILVLGAFLAACFVLLFLQLNNLQVRQAHALQSSLSNPLTFEKLYSQPRGAILSADGVLLAESVKSPHGIYKYQRVYPSATAQLFAQIVGYDSYLYGLDGVEASYNQYLEAHQKPAKTIGDLFTNRTVTDDVTLTLSSRLQAVAAQELQGKVGAVVAIDPSTGAIRAMYSSPSFDPNPLASQSSKTERLAWFTYNTAPKQPMLARAYRRAYPPGSTFKIVTTSAAYQFAPQLVTKSYPTYSCTALPNTNKQLCNYDKESCGGDIAELLPPSCDTGYGLLGIDIGAQDLYQQANLYGFDQHPPIDLPPSPYDVSNFPTPTSLARDLPGVAYSAIGQQDVQATALQMALVAAGVANSGMVMTPHVMASIRDSQGNLVESYQPKPWHRATNQQIAAAIRDLMIQVANCGACHGTAVGVFNPADDVAAKTGTAQVGTGNTATTDWMIAFAPAANPKIAVAVVVPNQYLSATGAAVSGPIASAMIEAALAGP
jgi:peptidoglycan glycosyltransferase